MSMDWNAAHANITKLAGVVVGTRRRRQVDDSGEPHSVLAHESQNVFGMMIHVADPLYDTLMGHMERTGESLKLKRFDRPTTVENLSHQLFSEITEMGFRLNRLEIRETDTSVVSYTRDDWVNDNRYFAGSSTGETSLA